MNLLKDKQTGYNGETVIMYACMCAGLAFVPLFFPGKNTLVFFDQPPSSILVHCGCMRLIPSLGPWTMGPGQSTSSNPELFVKEKKEGGRGKGSVSSGLLEKIECKTGALAAILPP